MDPKSTQPLDPKLQKAYDKVMGVQMPQTNPVTTPAQTVSDTSIPVPTENPLPSPILPPSEPANSQQTSTVSPSVMEQTVQVGGGVSAPFTYDTPAPAQGFSAGKKKTKISPILLVFGGIVFLLIYSLVWIKVFNLQVPYINP